MHLSYFHEFLQLLKIYYTSFYAFLFFTTDLKIYKNIKFTAQRKSFFYPSLFSSFQKKGGL